HLKRPTREPREPRDSSPIWPCSEWGLPCHGPLPAARCALTAPFHPCLCCTCVRTSAVCFLWHFPSARAAQALPGTLPCGARTFLHGNEATVTVRPTPGRTSP